MGLLANPLIIKGFFEVSSVKSKKEFSVVKSVESFIRCMELHFLKYFIVCYT